MPDSDEDFEVLPENWEAVTLFLRVATQWRASFGGLFGLDYSVLFEVMRLYGIVTPDAQKDVFERVKVIEQGVLSYSNKGNKNG